MPLIRDLVSTETLTKLYILKRRLGKKDKPKGKKK